LGERTSQFGRAVLACALYGLGLFLVGFGIARKRPPTTTSVHPLERALARGFVSPQVPRLAPQDAFANAAILNALLEDVPFGETPKPCDARPRLVAVQLRGQLSRVRFSDRQVCKLRRLKEASTQQEGLSHDDVAEVAAFLIGKRLGDDVDVTRIVVPPFRFAGDALDFVGADLGKLDAHERLIGTYHTHPGNELEQGVLSETDLAYMVSGVAQFQTEPEMNRAIEGVGGMQTSWLLDIVDPKWGDWNVYAHDQKRLSSMQVRCVQHPPCPLNELRLGGSDYNLFVRFFEETEAFPLPALDGL